MSNITEIITINRLNYKKIINNLSLSIKKSSFTTISGTNRSGKTTLLKIISGVIATSKNVLISSKYIEDYNKRELYESISLVTYNFNHYYDYQTVKEGLYKVLVDIKNNDELYKEIIKITDIKDIINNNPNNLNIFEKIKFELAQALASNPEILLIDNILLRINKKEKKDIINIIKKINEDKKITMIMVSNNLTDTVESDYLYILDRGTVALEGKPLDILRKDNEINRLGMDIPFMIDLSVKLSDYDILNEIILDNDRMIGELWK